MRLLDPLGRPRVILVTVAGTLFCIAVATFVDSYNFASLTDAQFRRALMVNIAVPTVLAAPLLFLLMSKIRQLALAHRELEIIASTDSLTAVLNRGAFTMLVEAYLQKAEDEAQLRSGALLVVDVDHFKAINDTYGHDYGDRALKLIAASIRNAVRSGDMVGRLGGEEFGVLLPGADPGQARAIAERIRSSVADTVLASDDARPISVSVGGVTFKKPASFEVLFRAADRQLYDAKGAGRNRVMLHKMPGETITLSAGYPTVH